MANKTQNCPGVGNEYEIFVPALFALKLHNRKDVEDFTIQSNVSEGFGNLEDVVIDIVLESGSSLHFAFQLKHKERKTKNLLPSNFEAKGDFNLEKYWKAFQGLPRDTQNRYNFILYTNANFDNKRKKELVNFTMTEDDQCVGKTYFETSNDWKNVYKFRVNNNSPSGYDLFLSKFTLFTCQKSYEDFENEIFKILKSENATRCYKDLFRKWHLGRFSNKTIDKKTISFHLIDAFASSDIITGYQISDECELFEKAINEFDVTVIDDSKEILCTNFTTCQNVGSFLLSDTSKINFEQYRNTYKESTLSGCLLRLAKEYKIIEKTANQIDNVTEMKIFSYFIQHLLLINFDFDENSREAIYELLSQVKEGAMRFVLIGRGVDASRFKTLKVFYHLEDLKLRNDSLYLEVVQKCTLSLQGRKVILEHFIDEYKEVLSLCRSKAVLQMLKTDVSIGEALSDLPAYYIPRRVSTIIFDLQEVIKLSKENKSIIIIISSDKIQQIRNTILQEGVMLVEIQKFLQNPNFSEKKFLLLTTVEQPREEVIRKLEKTAKDKAIYLMKMVSLSELILMKSTFVFSLKPSKTLEIKEEDVYSVFDGSMNILIAEPGMGKSTMMKYLSNKYPWKFWIVNITLKDHNTFFQKEHSAEELVYYFTSNETKTNEMWLEWIAVFKKQKTIIFFFDGFDEVSHLCSGNVLLSIDNLSRAGFPVWLSSRANMQQQILTVFQIFSINIVELTETEQKKYVEDRLAKKYTDDNIRRILSQISSSVQLVNNKQVLGVPLQLYILTQILLDNKQSHQNLTENFFILTKMYKSFFEGRFKHCIEKFNLVNPCPFVYDSMSYLEQYEIVALRSIFDAEVLKDLRLDERRNKTFLNEIESGKDVLGIIIKVENGEPTFQHHTYAEYFTSVFLSKDLENAKRLGDHLFSDRYRNLMVILSIMLAEENPLHLAVIYRNFQQLELHLKGETTYDRGGRNPLHIAVSLPSHSYKPIQKEYDSSFEDIRENLTYTFQDGYNVQRQDYNLDHNYKIIKKVLEKFDPYERDCLFDKDSSYYAIVQKNLFAVDAILENYRMTEEVYNNLKKYEFISSPTIAFYATLWGYLNLLSVAFDKKHSQVTKIGDNVKNSLLHVSAHSTASNKAQIINMLIQYGLSINSKNLFDETVLNGTIGSGDLNHTKTLLEKGATLEPIFTSIAPWLQQAFYVGDLEMVNFFLDLDITNIIWKDMLYLATCLGYEELITFLLKQGKEIDFCFENGQTALHEVAQNGLKEAFTLLLKYGANYNTLKDSTILHSAATGGNIDIVNICLDLIQDIDPKDSYYQTPLFSAIRNGNVAVTNLLIDKGANLKHVAKGKIGTVLHVAVERGDSRMLELLIDKGSKVNGVNYHNETPLMVACNNINNMNFFVDVIKVLIRNGAKISHSSWARKFSLWPFLLHISKNKQKEITKLILQKYSNTQFTDLYANQLTKVLYGNCWKVVNEFLKQDDTDLKDLLTARTFLYNKENMKLLLQGGFKPNLLNKNQVAELIGKKINKNMFKVVKLLIEEGMKINYNQLMIKIISQKQLSENEVQFCIDNGADVNACDQRGRTALYIAITTKQFSLVNFLIKHEVDVNCITRCKKTIRGSLSKYYSIDTIEFVFQRNVNSNLTSGNSFTPLYYAVRYSNKNLVNLLLNKGAQVNDLRALHSAVQINIKELVQIFSDRNYQVGIYKNENLIMPTAGSKGNCEVIDLLLNLGFHVNSRNLQNKTALSLAVQNNHLDAAKFLIEKGADFNEEIIWEFLKQHDPALINLIQNKSDMLKNFDQCLLLLYAIRNQDEEFVEFLLHNAKLNFNNRRVVTEAMLCDNTNILLLLLGNGFQLHPEVNRIIYSCLCESREDMLKSLKEQHKISITDENLYIALHLAVYLGDTDFVTELLKEGIDFDFVDVYNSIYPLHFATKNRFLESNLLIEKTAWIDQIYLDRRIWKLQHMRSYILKKYSLRIEDDKRKHKYPYLLNEYDVSAKVDKMRLKFLFHQ